MSRVIGLARRTRGRGVGGGGGGSGETVNFLVTRYDGSSGSVMVTGAIPLKPGAMFAADMTKLRIRDDSSTEKAIGVDPSRGLFPDGSLRSVHVQFLHTLNNLDEKVFTVEIGGTARGTSDLTWADIINSSATATVAAMNHKAFIIPDDSQYWCDTFVALVPLKPEASETADVASTFFQTATGTSATYGEWVSFCDSNYGQPGIGLATYEHAHGYLCASIRANSRAKRLAFFKRFVAAMSDLIYGYLSLKVSADVGVGGNSYSRVWAGADSSLPTADASYGTGLTNEAKSGMSYGLGTLYLMTGWRQPWRHLCMLGSWTYGGTSSATAKAYYVQSDTLPRYNVSQFMMYRFMAYVVGATMQVGNGSSGYGAGRDNTTASWTNDLTWSLDALEDNKFTTGNYGAYIDGIVGCKPTATDGGGSIPSAGAFPTFQLSVVARCLIFYYHNIDDDARIPVWLQTMADFVANQLQDQTTLYSLPYFQTSNPSGVTYDGTEHSGTTNKRDPWYAPFFTELFGWVYAYTATSSYKTWALRCANARELTNPSPFTPTIKALGEYFGGHMQSSKFYIDGGAVRPISGAHPTSITTRTTYTS